MMAIKKKSGLYEIETKQLIKELALSCKKLFLSNPFDIYPNSTKGNQP